MNPFQHTAASVFAINVKLLGAAMTACMAWFIWPAYPQAWALGLVSIFMGVAAIILLIDALKVIVKLYAREVAIARYLAQGPRPKAAEMVSADTLSNAGMLDD